ncbi:hypothetical protein [Musicola keenii]|uniref:hypothetical protein n=1 Tax=Musicola keenii TaxID=2884250 RepID=UPI001782413A|nr:hypothetical protein [Musicola keenii]
MKMNVARRLSEAIGSWLHMEFCCYRAGLLSESSLKTAVGQVLSSFPKLVKGSRVYADFAHDVLNPQRNDGSRDNRGRKRELDFALVLSGDGVSKGNAQIVIETKWSQSSHCTPDNIFKDFLRLASVKMAEPDTICVFILAGTHKEIKDILKNMPFYSSGKAGSGIHCTGNEKRVNIDFNDLVNKDFFSKAVNYFTSAGISIPVSFVCQSHGLHPHQTKNGTVDFQAIAWEIKSVSHMVVSTPTEISDK